MELEEELQAFADEAFALAALLPDAPEPVPSLAAASSRFVLSLHTADPGESGAHEATYAGYARTPVKFAVVENSALVNESRIEFPTCVGGAELITHVGVWAAEELLLCANFGKAIPVSTGVALGIDRGSFAVSS